MLELNRQVRDLYKAYEHKPLKPETALEIVSDFVLDLINVFGDRLDEKTPLHDNWRQFAPFEFILGLNEVLRKYKEQGHEALDETERAMLADHGVLLGSLIRAALTSHPDAFPDEEHFQIPDVVAKELLILSETG
ncbi:MAG TPA: hypothetical protein V6D08_17470 [Candidatus Obscuribacterales bacterium]